MAHHLGVRYLYEEASPPGRSIRTDDRVQVSERLRQLPGAWAAELKQAATELDPVACRQVLDRIEQQDSVLAEGLAIWVDEFHFDRILEAINQAENSP
jgi:hypothetical protein